MKTLNINVSSSEVLKTGTFSLVQYEVNVGCVLADFSPDWEGLNKVATFYDAKGEEDIAVPMAEEKGVFCAVIPPEATRYGGNALFVIDGYRLKTDEDGAEVLDFVIRTKPVFIKIVEAPKRGEGEALRISSTDYERLLNLINALSEKVGEGTEELIESAIEKVINGAPEALDTLRELSEALGNDPNFATTILTELGKKADKEELSSKADIGECEAKYKYQDCGTNPSIFVQHNYNYQARMDNPDTGDIPIRFPDSIPDVFEFNFYIESVSDCWFFYIMGSNIPVIRYFGDDCDDYGYFSPHENTSYEANFRRVGTDTDGNAVIVARIRGWRKFDDNRVTDIRIEKEADLEQMVDKKIQAAILDSWEVGV